MKKMKIPSVFAMFCALILMFVATTGYSATTDSATAGPPLLTHEDSAAQNVLNVISTGSQMAAPLVDQINFGQAESFVDSVQAILTTANTDPATGQLTQKGVQMVKEFEEYKSSGDKTKLWSALGLLFVFVVALISFLLAHFHVFLKIPQSAIKK